MECSATTIARRREESVEFWHHTADRWGNAVAFTQSLSGGFGSGVVAGETGIFLNNGHSFVLDPDHVNSLEGRARAKGVMTPALVLRDERLLMAVGAAGGYTIPQTVGQVITKALVYGMEIQRAIASPRMMINRGGGRVPTPGDSHTYLEAGFPDKVYAELSAWRSHLRPPGQRGSGPRRLRRSRDGDSGRRRRPPPRRSRPGLVTGVQKVPPPYSTFRHGKDAFLELHVEFDLIEDVHLCEQTLLDLHVVRQ